MKGWLVLGLLVGCSKGALEEEPPAAKPLYDTEAAMPAGDASGTTSATPATDAGTGDAAAVPQPIACPNGVAEREPNDTMAKATPLAMGKTCGAITPSDVDFFLLPPNELVMLRVDSEGGTVLLAIVQTGGSEIDITVERGLWFESTLPAYLRVTSRSTDAYAVIVE
jgi:hypothetical protein